MIDWLADGVFFSLCYSWIADIKQHLQRGSVGVLGINCEKFKPNPIPLCTKIYPMGHLELFQGLSELQEKSDIPNRSEGNKLLSISFTAT